MTEKSEKGHYYWLDMLRGMAAFIVVITHCRGNLFVEYDILPPSDKTIITTAFFFITRIAHEAVLLFFVLSGFLVGGKTIERLKANSFNIKSYSIDRIVRIMLPLVSAFILILTVNIITNREFSPADYIGNLLSLQGILVEPISGPLWSLAYEVWFYVLMGGVALWFITSKQTYKYIAVIILFIIFAIFSHALKATYLFIWLLGAMSFFHVKKNNILLFVSLLSTIVSILAFQLYGRGHDSLYVQIIIELFIGLSMCLLIQQVIHRKPKFKIAVLINKFGTKLANFSYTLYLTHVPVIYLLIHFGFPKSESINTSSLGYYFSAIIICLFSAYIIYFFFEKRTKSVKDFLKKKLS